MKKTFIYSFVVVFTALLVSCGVFAKNQNSTYKTELDTSATEILKGKDLTRERTPIDIYDVLGIQEKTPNNGMVFEAAWSPDGATFINRTRWFETLSEIRQECPNKLKDRINESGDWTTSQKAKQNWPNSLLFNDSLVRKRD